MPVTLVRPSAGRAESTPDNAALDIGLLNNLSDAALERGERQFVDCLQRAAGLLHLRLHLFSLPEIRRGATAVGRIASNYTPFAALWDRTLDGLIVTGCEPSTARLEAEPFWASLAKVIDWAANNTRSTIWSCLAAHAAVLHLDGVQRRRLTHKLSGLYPTVRVGAHALVAGTPGDRLVPHSRYNDLAESDLVAAGYEILTRSPVAGVDTFVKHGDSTFVFLQGHPEYDADALYREYRRDVARYLDHASDIYPGIPENNVSSGRAATLRALEARAKEHRDRALLAELPLTRGQIAVPGQDPGAELFANWLAMLRVKTVEHAA